MHFINEPTFIVAVAFLVFVILAGKPILKMLFGMLDTRTENIKKELDEAIRLKEEAQALLASYKGKQKKAEEEAEEILAFAQEEADRIIAQGKKKVEEELTKRSDLAVQKIAQAEASAIKDIRDNAVDITMSVARQLIIENLTPEAAQKLISDAMLDVNRKFH